MNHVRALRLAEIMQDFRNIQQCIAQITATPSPQDHYSEGYQILEQCLSDSKAVLRAPFITSPSSSPQGDIEAEKEQLQRQVILCCSLISKLLLIGLRQQDTPRRQHPPFPSTTDILARRSCPALGSGAQLDLGEDTDGGFANCCAIATRHETSRGKSCRLKFYF